MRSLSLVVVLSLASVAESQQTRPKVAEPAKAEPAKVAAIENAVLFNRDIRPILSNRCFSCHGPDAARRKGQLRLDIEKDAIEDRGGYHVIAPGKVDKSLLMERITDTDDRMPPKSAGPPLNKKQIDLLKRWIAQGAKWQNHWSLIAPQRPKMPTVSNRSWPRNPIDYFVLRRLEKEGLSPAPEADRVTLLRRVTLDLTGLPPTPAEMDAFVADKSPDAYEKVVDRLLRSPRFGERLAKPWLDAARYADTNGYQTDGDRVMWRWRDWVIDAFNNNMPFDQFTIEQLAGDLLPDATLQQKIATGFNRNHRGNSEGGVIPEEFAVEYVVDRLDTTFTVWLGFSIGCARCHSHKYDPLTQTEFYQLYAYFNNVPERGKAIKYGNSPPYIKSPTPEQEVEWKLLQSQVQAAKHEWQQLQPRLARAQRRWEESVASSEVPDWTYTQGLPTKIPSTARLLPVVQSEPAAAVAPRPGSDEPAQMFPTREVMLFPKDVGNFGFFDKFSLAAWIHPTKKGGPIISRMQDSDRADGYSVVYENGKIHVNLVKRWLDDCIRVETKKSVPAGEWHHVFVSYDGSRLASGVRVYIDGKQQELQVNLDDLNQSFETDEPVRIGAGGGQAFHGALDDIRIYDHVLEPAEVALVAETASIGSILNVPAKKRTAAQAYKLRRCFLDRHAPKHLQDRFGHLRKVRKELVAFEESLPTTMVMVEMPRPRPSHVLIRGEYDKPGKEVPRALPDAFPPMPAGAPNDRLGFAKWLVSPANPLTARVAVNRFWQLLFGTGIVKTVEDFGSQGEWPSHPELLDWLAVEFMTPETGGTEWDIKRLLKTIVLSATYRQSSKLREDLVQRDPDNRLLARGPRVRLEAEVIRDQALFVSGLLVEHVGGPSVHPYQPKGLISELHGSDDTKQDHGPNLYRRSLYTFWKRTVPPPAMMTFDAANRETCVVRQSRTNTPLQALNLLNDVTYVEAARVLAQRIMHEGGKTPGQRLAWAFRLATGRKPRDIEGQILVAGYEKHLGRFRQDKKAAQQLASAGEYPSDPSLDAAELAAYTAMTNAILNLDEVITKE